MGSYGRVSLGECSEGCGLKDCCEVLSDWVWTCICDPELATVIPLSMSPSAKRVLQLANGALQACSLIEALGRRRL
jgi:hypothetical protein